MHRGLCVFSAAFVVIVLVSTTVPFERKQEIDLPFDGGLFGQGHARRLRATDPFHCLSRHFNWTETIDWTVLYLPADIRSSYDTVCDPATTDFHTNNSWELSQKANFTMQPAGTLGILQVALTGAQVALAWFSAPSLPIPTFSLWKGDDPYLANRYDPKLDKAGPALANVVVPPSIAAGITSTYMAVKMKDRADMGGLGMPWSVDFQVFIFLAQVVQGLVAAWLAFFVGRNNFIWLLRNYSLTFRFEIWGRGLFQVVRLLLTFKAMQYFLGINVTRFKASRHNWRNTFRFHEYPWRMEDQDDPIKRLERVVWVLDGFSKYVILPTAAIIVLFFLPSFIVNLLPGAVLGFAARWAYYKCCSRRRSSDLQEPLQLEEGRQTEQAERLNLFSILDNVGQLILVFAFSILCGYLTSMLTKSYMSADTFLCPYSKMVIAGFKFTEHFDSLSAYMTTIIVLALATWILILMMGAVKKCRSDGSEQDERLSADGWRAVLIHAMWVARCNRECHPTTRKMFEALSFAAISRWEDDQVPSPSERDKAALMEWANHPMHNDFPDDYKRQIGNPKVGAGKCLRKAGCRAQDLRESRGGGFSCKQLKEIGYASKEVFQACSDAKELREADYSAKELKQEGDYSVKELWEAGYNSKELRDAGFSALELLSSTLFEAADLVDCGYSAKELGEARVDEKEIVRVRVREKNLSEFMEREAKELHEAGWVIEDLLSTMQPMLALLKSQKASEHLPARGIRIPSDNDLGETAGTGPMGSAQMASGEYAPTASSSASADAAATAGAAASAAASAAAPASAAAHKIAPSAQATEPRSTVAAMPTSVAAETTGVGSVPPSRPRAETAQADGSEVAIGDLVELHGMSNDDYNGKVGVIVRRRADSGRWEVELPEREVEKGRLRKTPQVKPSNLRKTQIENGDMVELCNMKTAGLNRTSGRVLRNLDDRWEVQLPERNVSVKADSLKLLCKAATQNVEEQQRPAEQADQQRREQARTGQCAIHTTSISSGVAPCQGGERQECMWCKKYFCLYHYAVNNSDSMFSFGGHVCVGAPQDANARSGAIQGKLPRIPR